MKPEYKVQGMKEVMDTKSNGLNVVSTFSGCGGSSLGYRMAGYRVLWANEFVPNQRAIYEANMTQGTHVNGADIRSITSQDIMKEAGIKKGELDILDGSPPCKSFSTSGTHGKTWGEVVSYSQGKKQRTDDLFYEYIRLLDGLQPRAFIAENVPGLSRGVSKGVYNDVFTKMQHCGYTVKASILKSEFLGVPQSRHRLFFVGVRNDLKKEPEFPIPDQHTYTIREAFHGDEVIDETLKHTWLNWPESDNSKKDPRLGIGGGRNKHTQRYFVWKTIPPGHSSRKRFNASKANPDRACPTVTVGGASASGCWHWEHPRQWTIAELKRLCAFPEDFILLGKYPYQYEALARAVPPLVMKRLAESLIGVLDG